MGLKWEDLSEGRSVVETVQRAGRILVYTVNCAGYRPRWGKENICVHLWTDVLKGKAYKLRKRGRKLGNTIDKLTVTAVHILHFEPCRRHQCTTFGEAKIIQRRFPLYDEKSRLNRMLQLALNVVQYYNARLKVIANVDRSHNNCSFREKETMTDTGNVGRSAQ
jgi:hypothetical protein